MAMPPRLALGRLVTVSRARSKPGPKGRPIVRLVPAVVPLRARWLIAACAGTGLLLAWVLYLSLQPAVAQDAPELATVEATRVLAEVTPEPPVSADPTPLEHPALTPSTTTSVPEDKAETEAAEATESTAVETPAEPPTPVAIVEAPKPVEAAAPPSPSTCITCETPALASLPGASTPGSRLVDSSKLGTRIVFFRDPPDAFAKAGKDNKLVFYVHLSGNFEDNAFT